MQAHRCFHDAPARLVQPYRCLSLPIFDVFLFVIEDLPERINSFSVFTRDKIRMCAINVTSGCAVVCGSRKCESFWCGVACRWVSLLLTLSISSFRFRFLKTGSRLLQKFDLLGSRLTSQNMIPVRVAPEPIDDRFMP